MIIKLASGYQDEGVKNLFSDKVFNEDYTSIINPGTITKVVLNKGDNLMDLLKKYPNQSVNSLIEKAEKAGLAFDSTMTLN